MPRRNGIKILLPAFLLLAGFSIRSAESRPMVIGYDRFHSDEPSLEGGRILFNELGCVNCHNHSTGLPPRKGPSLDGILHRSHSDWIRTFLKNPAATKPGTQMPQMHLSDPEIEAVLHYLGSIEPAKTIPDAFRFINAERGMALYHEIGCAACHEPSPDFHPVEGKPTDDKFTYPNIPLIDLRKKYDFDSLNAFLYEPHDYWPQGRMPKFKLDREDGGDLTAHLLDYQNGDSTEYPSIPEFVPNSDLIIRGKRLLKSRNCVACHDTPATEEILANPLSAIRPNVKPAKDHPQYQLDEYQSRSIDLFLASPQSEAPVQSQLQTLNCMACHDRDGQGGPDSARKTYFAGDHDLGDSGLYPPPLTEAGRKFQPDWLEAAIKGNNHVRPYLKTQMPLFGDSVHELTDALIREDALETETTMAKGNVDAGRKLLGTLGGLNCITCHSWNERRSLGIRGLNLSTMAERLQPGWLHDYLIDPGHTRPNTLMPSFWPKGVASNQEILEGNTKAQMEAIWAFSKSGEGLPEGFPDEDSLDYEIIPSNRPVVQRSFMEGVGTKALLVGFPQGVHLAFDGKSGEPAILWKGRFFDAYRTWYSRFPEFEKPLGSNIVTWPISENQGEREYRGYRLDSAGIPEFVLALNGAELFERYIPKTDANGKTGMQRVIRYTRERQLADPRLRHPDSVTTIEVEDNDPMTRSFIYQW